MKILLDYGTPAPLRQASTDHSVATAYEKGWAGLTNGELLTVAEEGFDVLVTTGQNLRYQHRISQVVSSPFWSFPRPAGQG